MFEVEKEVQIKIIDSLPLPSGGAPIPLVLSNDNKSVLAYYTAEQDKSVLEDERIAIITFSSCYASNYGAPNDEAFSGHPLYEYGLRPYNISMVNNSPWIRHLCKINSVHPYHSDKMFEDYKHFVIHLKDSTYECIAKSADFILIKGDMRKALEVMKKIIWSR